MTYQFINLKGSQETLDDLPNRFKANLAKVPSEFMREYMTELETYTKGLFSPSPREGAIRRGFEGSLMNAVKSRVSRKGLTGYLYIDSDTISNSPDTTFDTAKMLEEGVAKHKVYIYNLPKARRWAEIYNPQALKKGYMVVGGERSGVKLGASSKKFSDSVFWRAMNAVNKHVDESMKNALELRYTGQPL